MPTTPPANITSKCPLSLQNLSRLPGYDSQVPRSRSTTPSSAQAQPPLHLTAHLTSSYISAQGPSHHSPPEQDVSTERPTKRRRSSRPAIMAAERASSSSDSSSQSGMADNETEAERSQPSERSAPQAAAPPKKKRTRTLTTPHQSAVLHALLAKSRFPTTAMREEVGRQIGLSARKVQIWFQNQRQKARRPQAETGPLTRPPQFGPFPIMNPGGPSSPYPTGGPGSEMIHSAARSDRSVAHEPGGSRDSNPALSGPGMPGWSPQHGPSSADEWDPPRRVPTSPEVPPGNLQHPLPSRVFEGIRDSRVSTRGLPPQPAPQATNVETSPRLSRTLPPIPLNTSESRSITEPYVSATSSFPPQSSSSLHSSVNFVQRHDFSSRSAAVEPSSPRSLGIPPPFALQPQPQWDPRTFSPYTRPEFASWSQTSSGSSLPPLTRTIFPTAGGTNDRVTHDPSPASRQFYPSSLEDPRHATPLDSLSRLMIPPPSRGRRLLSSTPHAHTSTLGDAHARSDDEGS